MMDRKTVSVFGVLFLVVTSQGFDRNLYFSHLPHASLDLDDLNASSGCPFQPVPVPLPQSSIETTLSQLSTLFSAMFKNTTGITGMSASLVYRDQIIWNFGDGVISLKNNTTPDENTIFRIGSVTKALTTALMYQAWENDVFDSLDSPINATFPQFNMINPYPNNGITWRQVASQLAGLPRECPCLLEGCNVTTDVVLARLKSISLIYPPDTTPSYSNLGFALIGRLLESDASETYEELVQNYILQVLNMTNSGFDFTDDILDRMALSYSNGEQIPITSLAWAAPCGQAYSTTKDLAAFIMSFLQIGAEQDSPILGLNAGKDMISPVFINPDGTSLFGTPWEMIFQNNYLVRNKGGNVGGYSGLISFVPELQLGLSILWSGQVNEFTWSQEAYNLLIPGFVSALTPLQPPAVRTPPTPANFAGKYQFGGEVVAAVVEQNGVLVMGILGYSFYLNWESDNTFRSYVPPTLMSCQAGELLALTNNFVYFQTDASGAISSVTMPAWFYGVVATKVN